MQMLLPGTEEDFCLQQSKTLKTRKRVFLEQMERVVPWKELVALIAPHAPKGPGAKGGRPPFAVETMLRIHFLQQWFSLSDPAAEEALHDMPVFRHFAGLNLRRNRIPDETTILKFRRLLEKHDIGEQILKTVNAKLEEMELLCKVGTLVDATIIEAPTSTKNKARERDQEMHSTKKGNQWHFGLKAHTGVDAESGLVHTVVVTAANEHDVTQTEKLLHGEEHAVHADAGYQGAEKRKELQDKLVSGDYNEKAAATVEKETVIDAAEDKPKKAALYVAMRPGKRRALDKATDVGKTLDNIERLKARIRAKVEHPFRVIKRQFGYMKTRYRGLAKNAKQLFTLFALSNLWMVRGQLLPKNG